MAEIKKSQKSAPAGRKYIEVPVKSALPVWSAAAVWVLAALFVPMYNVMHILGVALVSLGVALLVKKLLPKETKTVEVPFASGNLELDAMVGEINKAVDSLEAFRKSIGLHDPETADVISSISATAEKSCGRSLTKKRQSPAPSLSAPWLSSQSAHAAAHAAPESMRVTPSPRTSDNTGANNGKCVQPRITVSTRCSISGCR